MSSSTSFSSKRPSKPRSQRLKQGKACLNCRHLKIRCDGQRPICGQCFSVPKDDECEYTDGQSRTKELQEAISRLQTRIHELENPRTLSTAALSDPPTRASNASPAGSSRPRSRVATNLTGRSLPLGDDSSSDRSVSPGSIADASFVGLQEPPFLVIQMLLDNFLPHGSQFGFFLHLDRFRNAALLQLPFGNSNRPSPALLSTVHLWGVHLSTSLPVASYETVFLRRALQHVLTEASSLVHPTQILHTIQAQILLSTYFFRNKKFLEANFHANGAVSLSLSFQLHKIRSARPPAQPSLPPARDCIEEGERINGFWTVVMVQRNLTVALNPPSSVSGELDDPGLAIDTPWPLDMQDYEAGRIPLPGSRLTIQNFLSDLTGNGTLSAIIAMSVQAAILLHHTTLLSGKWSPHMRPQKFNSYMNAFTSVDRRVTFFIRALPPVAQFYHDSSSTARTMLVTHALAAGAVIKLHATFCSSDLDSRRRCLVGAQTVLRTVADMQVPDFSCAGPMVGTLCMAACQVLIEEVARMRSFPASQTSMLDTNTAVGQEALLRAEIARGIATMEVLAVDSPLIRYQVTKIQQMYSAA